MFVVLAADVRNNGRSGMAMFPLMMYKFTLAFILSYECIWTYRSLLIHAEIPHHSGRSERSPAHPPFWWSGVSNAEKWFVVYFLMRQGDMGIRQLKLIETNTGACLSQPPTTVRISSKKHQQTRAISLTSPYLDTSSVWTLKTATSSRFREPGRSY